MNSSIPFNRPALAGNEYLYIRQALAAGHISGDGVFTKKCHDWLEKTQGVRRALLTTSCTHALEMSALLLHIAPGDEVIMPSFTFVSTANAFALSGARPVFCDIRRDTLNIDERSIEPLITPRTRAIVVVHYAGVGCEMEAILEIATRHRIAVVEDNAHGLFGQYQGRNLGTFGCLAALSFHETKNLTCGEGGALLINDPSLVERAEILREKGTNRSQFFRGQVDKYSWLDIGSSYLPSDILAAFLYAQMEGSDRIQAQRLRVWEYYQAHLAAWAHDHRVQLPLVPDHCRHPYHMFYMLLPTSGQRDQLIARLRATGIQSVFHYLPLHLSVMGLKFGGRVGDCPVTEEISGRLLRLPFFSELTDTDQGRIVAAIRKAYPSISRSR